MRAHSRLFVLAGLVLAAVPAAAQTDPPAPAASQEDVAKQLANHSASIEMTLAHKE